MPLDGNGNYNPPSPENPVRAGALIKSDDFNTTIDDISEVLSTAIYKDGQAPMEADLNMGTNNIYNISSLQSSNALTIRADEELQLKGSNVNIEPSLSINDSQAVSGITATAGVANTLISTNYGGLLDPSFIPFEPTADSAIKILTAANVNAGDFVFLSAEGLVMPCTIAYSEEIAIGFVLENYTAGEFALVYLVGYNNKIMVEGTPIGSPYVYISDTGANVVCYEPQSRKQIVGVMVGAGIARFLPQAPASSQSPLFLYFGNI